MQCSRVMGCGVDYVLVQHVYPVSFIGVEAGEIDVYLGVR